MTEENTPKPTEPTPRIRTSGDLEVSAYLEIAKEKGGQQPVTAGKGRLRARSAKPSSSSISARSTACSSPAACANCTSIASWWPTTRPGRRSPPSTPRASSSPAGPPASMNPMPPWLPPIYMKSTCPCWASATACRCSPSSWEAGWPPGRKRNTATPYCTSAIRIRRCSPSCPNRPPCG